MTIDSSTISAIGGLVSAVLSGIAAIYAIYARRSSLNNLKNISEVKENVSTIEKATNSMKDALVASTDAAARSEGREAGRLEEQQKK